MAGSVYWIGGNGNAYLKSSSGVKDLGKLTKDYGKGFDAQYGSAQATRIADPNPPKTPSTPSYGGGYSTPAPVYAPKINYSGMAATARSQAEGAVNPYYNDLLNKFLQGQAVQKKQQSDLTATTITNLEDELKNTLGGNEIQKTRTTEDTNTNLSKIAATEDQFQTDSGSQFEADRIKQAQTLAASGLTGGTAAQQQEAAQTTNATTEGRQIGKFQEDRDTQVIAKARTFEDLARSGEIATTGKEKGVKKANVDLANLIENQGVELGKTQLSLAKDKESDIASKSQAILGGLVLNWINSISNPAQRNAAYQAYGSLV